MNLSEFAKVVAESRKKESPRMIYNASIDHAKLLFTELIQDAIERKEDIRIVSGELNPTFYGALTDDATRALDKKITIKLIVLNPDIDLTKNPFVSILLNKGGEVYKAKSKLDMPHYILVGDKRFRLELDHKQAKAVASFNNEGIGKTLKNNFDNIVFSKEVDRQIQSSQ